MIKKVPNRSCGSGLSCVYLEIIVDWLFAGEASYIGAGVKACLQKQEQRFGLVLYFLSAI